MCAEPLVLRCPLAADLVASFSPRAQVAVLTERTVAEQVSVNALCAKHGIKFIAGDVRGVFAACFVDVGDQHVVRS